MSIGEPGCPELAAWTASMQSVRIVLTASFSIGAVSPATVRPTVTVMTESSRGDCRTGWSGGDADSGRWPVVSRDRPQRASEPAPRFFQSTLRQRKRRFPEGHIGFRLLAREPSGTERSWTLGRRPPFPADSMLSVPEPAEDLAIWNQILSAGAGHLDQIIACRRLEVRTAVNECPRIQESFTMAATTQSSETESGRFQAAFPRIAPRFRAFE